MLLGNEINVVMMIVIWVFKLSLSEMVDVESWSGVKSGVNALEWSQCIVVVEWSRFSLLVNDDVIAFI